MKMTTKNTIRLLVLLGGAVMLLLMMGNDRVIRAQTYLSATHDTFIDPNNPVDNYDSGSSGSGAGRLEMTYSNFPGFSPTRRSMIQFDVSSVGVPTGRSLLVFDLVEENLLANAAVDVSLYKLGDAWDETTLTWANAPADATTWPRPAADLLQTITVNDGDSGTVTFGSELVDNPVGAYIEQERLGDGTASFLIVLDGGNANIGFGGNFYFEDREDTGGSGNTPFIDVRTPTAIHGATFKAAQSYTQAPLLFILMVLLSGISVVAWRQKQR